MESLDESLEALSSTELEQLETSAARVSKRLDRQAVLVDTTSYSEKVAETVERVMRMGERAREVLNERKRRGDSWKEARERERMLEADGEMRVMEVEEKERERRELWRGSVAEGSGWERRHEEEG
jgi:hypothetical protein